MMFNLSLLSPPLNTRALRSFTISSAPPNGAITSTTHSRSPDFRSCGRIRLVPAASRASFQQEEAYFVPNLVNSLWPIS